MNNQRSTNITNYSNLGAQLPVAFAFLALLLLGSAPTSALGQRSVAYHSGDDDCFGHDADSHYVSARPDAYVIIRPIQGESTIVVREPEPSWAIVQTAPPAVRFEVRPPAPYPGAIWVKGHWWWSGVRYRWISGHYVRPIRGYYFVAPRWVSRGGYHYYIRGHYRPRDATVRRPPYHHYRHVGYYGDRYRRNAHYSRSHRSTTVRHQPRPHSTRYQHDHGPHRAHSTHGRGHSMHDRHESAPHRSSTSRKPKHPGRAHPHGGPPGHRTSRDAQARRSR